MLICLPTIIGSRGQSIFTGRTPALTAALDAAVNLGIMFKSSVAGSILGASFYRQAGMGTGHVAKLWTAGSSLLGTITYSSEDTALVGWDYRPFSAPIAISANTPYLISMYMANGWYAADTSGNLGANNFSAAAITNGVLTAYQDAGSDPTYTGNNGLFIYGTGFPVSTYKSGNYWIDVLFQPF